MYLQDTFIGNPGALRGFLNGRGRQTTTDRRMHRNREIDDVAMFPDAVHDPGAADDHLVVVKHDRRSVRE